MSTNTVDPAQPTASTVVVATDGSVTVTQVSNATTVTYPGVFSTPFNPADLSPILWLDASDETTITESGGAVSQWDNKGSLGNFTQGTASLQPTSGVTTRNSLNVVDFAGDFLTSADAASAYNDLHNGTQWICAAVVIGSYAAGVFNYLMGNNLGSNNQRGMFYLLEDRGGVGDEIQFVNITNGNASDRPVLNKGDSLSFPRNNWNAISVFNDPDNATAADRSKLYLDGSSVGANNSQTGTPSTSNAAGALQIGSNGAGNITNALTGSLAEIVVVAGANATEENRGELETYLADKWGITL